MNVIAFADRWAPGIGDPTVSGWLTAAAYSIVAVLCLDAARRASPGRIRFFWSAAALVLIFLAINKQLDLQSLLTQWGRDAARAQGWYDRRRAVQAAFIVAAGLTGVACWGWIIWWLRGSSYALKTALAGLSLLGFFVLLRASAFYHLATLSGPDSEDGSMLWVLEIASLAILAWGAWFSGRGPIVRAGPTRR